MKSSIKLRLIVLAVLVLSGNVYAFSGSGSGSEADPYVITDLAQLQQVNLNPNAHYILANDIDAVDTETWNGGVGFEPIGPESMPFKGSFDGQGYVISNLYINRPDLVGVGLFGRVYEGALVTDVGMENVNIFGRRYVGALIGSEYKSKVFRCWSTGIVRGSYNGQAKIGGLLGAASGAGSVVDQCFSEANVEGLGGAHQVGGLSGYNGHGSVMINCYAVGDVSGYWKVGGLVGDNPYPEGGYIGNCYSIGHVSGRGGGLVGFNYLGGVTKYSYWDINTSGQGRSYGGYGRLTEQMMQQGTFAGWDFENVWGIDEGESYPYLLAFHVEPNLVDIEIAGPEMVKEDSEAGFKAIAIYDDGSEEDITDKCGWFADDCDYAGIDANGVFWSDMMIMPEQVCSIYAEYEIDDEVMVAEKEISILPMCPSGSALAFDGVDDYVDLGNDNIFNLGGGSFTIMAWVQTRDMHSCSVSKHNGGHDGEWFHGLREGRFTFGGSQLGKYRDSDVLVNDGKWHHLVGVIANNGINDNDLYQYIDGHLDGDLQGIDDILFSNIKLLIGDESNHLCRFSGLIDEVAIFNRALSAEEIEYNMYHKLAGSEAGLVGYWDFDEGDGNIVHDKSGNGNDGRIIVSPYSDPNDPCNPEPNWVEGAPYLCTRPQLVERNLDRAIGLKEEAMMVIDDAMKMERASMMMLWDIQREKAYGEYDVRQIVRARVLTVQSFIKEYWAKSRIRSSIADLMGALDILEGNKEKPEKKDKGLFLKQKNLEKAKLKK